MNDSFHPAAPLAAEGSQSGSSALATVAPSDEGSAQVVHLLRLILERLPDPNAPLGEAVEWESNDGCHRTTDLEMARNWAGAIGVTVVRRAPPRQVAPTPGATTVSPLITGPALMNKDTQHD